MAHGNYPRLLKEHEQLEANILPTVLTVSPHSSTYVEYVYLGYSKTQKRIVQGALIRSLNIRHTPYECLVAQQGINQAEQTLNALIKEFEYGHWYKINTFTEFVKQDF